MKIIVLGAGVVGVTTAYFLARAGVEVIVIDRQSGPGLETSFANAGQLSYGYATPWGAPGIPLKAFKWMFAKHAPLSLWPDGTLFQLHWLHAMLRNCSAERYTVNKERMLRLASYSRECLQQLRADTGIEYEARTHGTLQLFRSRKQLDQAQRDIRVLEECGIAYELLDRAATCRAEPALRHARDLVAGALLLPGDETGDCHTFTHALAQMAEALGVQFRFDTEIEALEYDARGAVSGVRLGNREVLHAKRYVLACGSWSRKLLLSSGLDLPVYPVKGYSLTVPIVDASLAPVSTVLDETYKIALTRFDTRIRVGGMAELGGFDLRLRPQRRATLEMVTQQLFPGGDLQRGEFWTGLRPMTPDSTPIIGRTPIENLYLNTGHGTLGWTLACGSGQLLADILIGKATDISTEGLSVERYLDPGARHHHPPTRPFHRPA